MQKPQPSILPSPFILFASYLSFINTIHRLLAELHLPPPRGVFEVSLHPPPIKGKGISVPLEARSGPEGSRKLRFPDYMRTAQDGGRLSALRTGRLYPQEMSWYSFLLEAESTPGP